MNPKLKISKGALISNIQRYRKKTSSSFICPMVKANAYGVGDSLVVRELLNINVTEFGVARVSEGLALRRNFPNDNFEILVFAPLTERTLYEYINSGLTAVVGSENDLKILNELDQDLRRSLKKIHINFDLGMSRLGFSFSETSEVQDTLEKMHLEIGGVCGHFSEAKTFSTENSISENSMKTLIDVAKTLGVPPNKVHAPNTEALNFKSFDVGIRPGIGLYGINGDSHSQSVLSLTAPLVQKRFVEAGDKVSYGGLWTASKKTQIGVFSIGYADGLKRGLSGKIFFQPPGNIQPLGNIEVACPQVGAICMDYAMVDLGLDEDYKLGEEFVLFNDSRGVMNWCEMMNCIPYEILTGFGNRVDRVLVK